MCKGKMGDILCIKKVRETSCVLSLRSRRRQPDYSYFGSFKTLMKIQKSASTSRPELLLTRSTPSLLCIRLQIWHGIPGLRQLGPTEYRGEKRKKKREESCTTLGFPLPSQNESTQPYMVQYDEEKHGKYLLPAIDMGMCSPLDDKGFPFWIEECSSVELVPHDCHINRNSPES